MRFRADLYDEPQPVLRRTGRRPLPIIPGLFALVVSGLVAGSILSIGSAPERPSAQPSRATRQPAAPILSATTDDPALRLAMVPVAFGSSLPLPADLVSAVEGTEAVAPAEVVASADPSLVVLPEQPVSPVVQAIPLPVTRPSAFGSAPRPPFRLAVPRLATRDRMATPDPVADNRGFFERLFGGASQPPGPALAYAAPEDGAVRRSSLATTVTPDHYTAIYDIEAHTVFMPDGARLEAHSGLGNRLDDPRFVHERNRGATPPSLYDLTPREQLFHGVKALRLTPVGGGTVFGRTGLLAHTFMLGPNGDSNGCVSFRDYDAFLQAYHSGAVKRLAVVIRRT